MNKFSSFIRSNDAFTDHKTKLSGIGTICVKMFLIWQMAIQLHIMSIYGNDMIQEYQTSPGFGYVYPKLNLKEIGYIPYYGVRFNNQIMNREQYEKLRGTINFFWTQYTLKDGKTTPKVYEAELCKEEYFSQI